MRQLLLSGWHQRASARKPYIPTKGDVPTIGMGSTHYENGMPVKMTDQPITRERAAQLARNLAAKDEEAISRITAGREAVSNGTLSSAP